MAVAGPVQQVLHQVLVILKNTFWEKRREDLFFLLPLRGGSGFPSLPYPSVAQ